MRIHSLSIPDVKLIQPHVHGDERGFFMEAWHQERYRSAGIGSRGFCQLNHSRSGRGILRGLHFQLHEPQGKLVRLLGGEVLDVAVDLRPDSSHFGNWVSHRLTAASFDQLWVPEGFAHGFLVLSDSADFEYFCTAPYRAEDEGCIHWQDPDLAIEWPIDEPRLSPRDATAPGFRTLLPRLEAHYRGLIAG